MPSVRINKYLAHATGISRRQADDAIAHGHVTIDGQIAQMGAHVAENAIVTLNGILVGPQRSYTYILLHKPTNYVCSRRRQGETPTIYELLPKHYHYLKPVGRLDRDSSGLLLLTDDGDFAHRMTHPSFHKVKVYEVRLNKPLEPLHQQMISDYGVTLEDGLSKFLIERQSDDNQSHAVKGAAYTITMSEGRNRQIRRTFIALGYTVTQLHRTTFGNYSLGDIKPGEYTLTDMR